MAFSQMRFAKGPKVGEIMSRCRVVVAGSYKNEIGECVTFDIYLDDKYLQVQLTPDEAEFFGEAMVKQAAIARRLEV